MSKNIVISIIVLVILVALFWIFGGLGTPKFDQSLEQELQSTSEQSSASVANPENNTVEANSSSDTTASIEADISNVDLGDLESDFSDIDSDLNSL